MSSVVFPCPEGPLDDSSRGVPLQAAEIAARLANAKPDERPQVADVALQSMLSWCDRLSPRTATRTRKHVEYIQQLEEETERRIGAIEQSLDAMPALVRSGIPTGCPAWIDADLIEETLDTFQPRYTRFQLVLLTGDDAVDMIVGLDSLLDEAG